MKLTALIKLLDFSNINLSIEKGEGKRGRPPRSPEAMLKAFVVMVFKGYSERGLETFLRNYPFWSRLCGFEGKSPCHTTFSNFKRRVGEDTLKKAMHTLVQQLVDAGVVTMKKVAVDSSALSTILTDAEAKWGYTREESFYGYKIHIACCADSELSVSISVTPGNVHDSTQCLLLMKSARSYRTAILYMIADTAYDSLDIYETLKEKYNIISVVSFNPRNSKEKYDYGIQRRYYYDTSVLECIYKSRKPKK